ncbi:MvaI/BcnI family restriction endonuclease [Hymenobacter rubidus]|uniref:MvaI/BcnI family restriction endonuclease n=1 Tax=Hymenobacter rubidus TaxID=1441626 RepID=UPI00191CBBC5|nr:MvaI/BcnI family restriction endonuclease [Hymenobacter rubidus]
MERADAVRLLNQLINKDLVQVAHAHGVTIFKGGKKNKGWAGHTLERFLSLPLNSSRAPNFGSWELKSTSLVRSKRDGSLRVKETIAITMLDPVEITQKEFEESHLYNKLRKTLIVARIHENQREEQSLLHSIAEFDLTNPALHRALKADYDLIRENVRQGNPLSGRLGKYIQPRTKGAGHGSTSRAFYARPVLVAHLLNIAPIRFDDESVVSLK